VNFHFLEGDLEHAHHVKELEFERLHQHVLRVSIHDTEHKSMQGGPSLLCPLEVDHAFDKMNPQND